MCVFFTVWKVDLIFLENLVKGGRRSELPTHPFGLQWFLSVSSLAWLGLLGRLSVLRISTAPGFTPT